MTQCVPYSACEPCNNCAGFIVATSSLRPWGAELARARKKTIVQHYRFRPESIARYTSLPRPSETPGDISALVFALIVRHSDDSRADANVAYRVLPSHIDRVCSPTLIVAIPGGDQWDAK
jgi:hypothetical protein